MGTRRETVISMTAARGAGRRAALAIGAAAVMATAAACGASSSGTTASNGKPLTNTTVLLDWFPNPDHIALYLAQKNGDFTAQGLKVTFQSPSNSTDALKLVSLGQVPLAISYEPETITAGHPGPECDRGRRDDPHLAELADHLGQERRVQPGGAGREDDRHRW